jgi:hypothetical protein
MIRLSPTPVFGVCCSAGSFQPNIKPHFSASHVSPMTIEPARHAVTWSSLR